MVEFAIPTPPCSGNDLLQKTYVYVIAVEGEAVKIGIAKDTLSRLRGLQTAHSKKLSIIHETACPNRTEARAVETIAHGLLKPKALEGEWFAVSKEDAIGAVNQAFEDFRDQQRLRREAAAAMAADYARSSKPECSKPEVIMAAPWMKEPADIIQFVLAQAEQPNGEFLFDFGLAIIFVSHRRQTRTGEQFFFMNDVSHWYFRRDVDKGPGDELKPVSVNPLGSPPCVLFATVTDFCKQAA